MTLAIGWVCLVLAHAFAADVDISKLPPPATQKNITFEKEIKPIFEKSNCLKCHGPKRQKGDLKMDTLADLMKGADGEPIVLKGNSAESRLVHAVARLDEDLAMPPEDKGDPLTKAQIALVRAWIDQGAK